MFSAGFIRNLDMSSKGLQNKRHLYFVTNIPITPTGNLAWPFHNPVPAQWWLVVPLIHAIWMLGTELEAHVEHGLDVHPDSNPKDFQRELSDEVSLLEIASPPPVRTGRLSLPLIIIEPPSPDEREEHPKDKKKEEDRGDDINWNPDRKHKFDETSFRHTHYKISQPMPPYPWKLPIPDALSIGSTLVPLLLFRKAGY